MQQEVEQREKQQRELDMLLLNEVASALTQRNAEDFKQKYDRLGKCTTLTEDDMSTVMSAAMQVDWDSSQEFISSALEKPGQRHYYADRSWSYFMTRLGGMHYGPNFRAVKDFAVKDPGTYKAVTYGVLTLHNEVRDGDWEGVSGYHPPMYDCGLQVQSAEDGYAQGKHLGAPGW